MEISVSILGAENKIEAIKKLNKTDANYLHLDIMDNKFVNNKSISFGEIKKLVSLSTKKLDVHLMVENPSKYIKDYAMLNTEYITIHKEIKNPSKYLEEIKNYGIKRGISINPNTDFNEVKDYLNNVDKILVMSVNPGLPGQTFIYEIVEKIKQIKEYISLNNLNVKIAVDGGINDINSIDLINSGVDVLAVGSFITNQNDYQNQIDKLKKTI